MRRHFTQRQRRRHTRHQGAQKLRILPLIPCDRCKQPHDLDELNGGLCLDCETILTRVLNADFLSGDDPLDFDPCGCEAGRWGCDLLIQGNKAPCDGCERTPPGTLAADGKANTNGGTIDRPIELTPLQAWALLRMGWGVMVNRTEQEATENDYDEDGALCYVERTLDDYDGYTPAEVIAELGDAKRTASIQIW